MVEKARITMVQIGSIEVEGIMLPDSTFGIAVPQIYELCADSNGAIGKFKATKEGFSKTLKRIMGADFKTGKIKTEFNKNQTSWVKLEEFEKILLELALIGSQKALDLARSLVGLSLNQLWADAFDIKFEKEERQEYLKYREQNKKQFHPYLTKWLQVDGYKEGKEYAKAVNIFKASVKLPLHSVDKYTTEELQQMNEAEIRYDCLRKIGKTHKQALANI